MDQATQTARIEEPDGAPRIAGLDVLRGVAIIAILFMNISDMGGSLWAFFASDIRHYGWSAADQVAWFVREVVASNTARCLLEMLFGAGMVILAERVTLKQYYWRNFVLFLLGVVHLFVLLWPGDILHTYGLAAMLAFLFRRLRPRWLLTIGLFMGVSKLAGGGYGIYAVSSNQAAVAAAQSRQAAGTPATAADTNLLKKDAEDRAAQAKTDARDQKRIIDEDKARTGTAATWVQSAWDTTITIQKMGLELLFIWEAATTMLIGAALYKLGILQGARSRGYYVRLTVIAYAIGLGSRTLGALHQMRFDDTPSIMWSMSEIARLATTLGHVGLVYVLLAGVTGARLLKPFEAAGRTALSIYILQTIACLWILYPPFALGLYGEQGWAAMMTTALVVNALLLWLATWWVRHYRIAPVEWAWRSIVEGRRLPFRRRGAKSLAGEPLPA